PPERHVLASNIYNASWQGLWAVGAALGGVVISYGGYGLAFYLATGLYTASLILMAMWLTPRRVAAYHAAHPTPTPAGAGATPTAAPATEAVD
ncbi:MAG TPA: hypothetical protein VET66_01640, partial [Steroidobacteraceae bacterium]|nr:hypothetical protein [Steroidobacteraceae bacterium]